MRGSTPTQLDVVTEPVNDEAPAISGTSTNRVFVEQKGPVSLVDSTVVIIDLDNRVNHTLIANITVTLTNPQPDGEDQLIVNGTVVAGNQHSVSCDPSSESDSTSCYLMYLTSLAYNNSNPEPGTFRTPRIFVIEVCIYHINYRQKMYIYIICIYYIYIYIAIYNNFMYLFCRHLTMLVIPIHWKCVLTSC